MCREFGWTPTQLNDQPVDVLEAFYQVLRAENDIKERKAKEAEMKAKKVRK